MQLASSAGAKVLHDRCVELAEKYNTKIIAASTFSDDKGTIIEAEESIEKNGIKSIVKNDDILLVEAVFLNDDIKDFLRKLIKAEIKVGHYKTVKNTAFFSILQKDRITLAEVAEPLDVTISMKQTSKISVIGTGISNNYSLLENIMDNFENIQDAIESVEISAYKISIQFNSIIDDIYLNHLHKKIY